MLPDEHHRRASDPRIDSIARDLAKLVDEVEEVQREMVKREKYVDMVKDHEAILRGDGNGKPGVLLKLDRLNVAMEDLKRLGWYILAAMVTVILGMLVNAIMHAA